MNDITEQLNKVLEQLKAFEDDSAHLALARTKITEAKMWIQQWAEDQKRARERSGVGFKAST